jgi:hypothetical protein
VVSSHITQAVSGCEKDISLQSNYKRSGQMQPQAKKAETRSTTRKKTNKTRVTVPPIPSNASTSEDLKNAQAADDGHGSQLSPDLRTVIAVRAYELYRRRGGQGDHELDDWLEAEREVLGGSKQ